MLASKRKREGTREPTLSFQSLQRSRATVEDFVRSYFPLHGLPLDVCLNFIDVLYFVEASLYECDEVNEQLAEACTACETPSEETRKMAALDAENSVKATSFEEAEQRWPAFQGLTTLLKDKGLLDDGVRQQLEEGLAYWALERELAAAPLQASVEQAQQALSMKSFDYRVLNLILYRLRGVPCDPRLVDFLRESELLVELEDDLKDYHKDVARNSFNIYRTYVKVYGNDAPKELANFIAKVEARYLDKRTQALDEKRLALHIARNEEQGSAGPVMAPKTGKWEIPLPVVDEEQLQGLARACGGTPPQFVQAQAEADTQR